MSRNNESRHSRNLAARMGRWSAAHWKTATFGWLAFVVVAFAIGGIVGVKSIDPSTTGPGESGLATTSRSVLAPSVEPWSHPHLEGRRRTTS